MSTTARLPRTASLAAIAVLPLAAALPVGSSTAQAAPDDTTWPLFDSGLVVRGLYEPPPSTLQSDSVFVPTGQPIAGSPLIVRG